MIKTKIPPGDLLCAVSGGADSTALLLCLREENRRGLCGRIVAAHMNHKLRGKASEDDEAFVRSLCARLGIPLVVRHADTEAVRRKQKLGLEDCARRLRYEFLETQRRLWNCAYICTAHTADDNLETLLLMLLRGAGLRGLGGIPPLTDTIARPFLTVSRAEILAFLASQGETFREDESNRSLDMRRNRLRARVVPLLCAENPALVRTASRSIALLRQDEEFLTSLASERAEALLTQAPEGWFLPVKEVQALPAPLRSRVLRIAAERTGVSLYGRQIDALLHLCEPGQSGKRLTLGGGVTAFRRQDCLLFGANRPATPLPCFRFAAENEAACFEIAVRADSIHGTVCLRTRQEGDRLRLAGRGMTKTVKKWLIDARVPREYRSSLCVVTDGLGLVAVEGLGVAERCAPLPGDRTMVLRITKNYIEKG